MGDCTEQMAEMLGAAEDNSAVGRRLRAGAPLETAFPEGGDVMALLREYALNMVEGLGQAIRALAFEVDELAVMHHRLAGQVEQLSGRLAALERT
jgi:hypothetical protein